MKLTANYQILQRDETGHAQATVSGKLPSELPAVFDVYARVVMEDISMPVVDWVPCKVQGDDWSVELSIPEGGLYRIEVSLAADKTVHLEWATKILCLFHIGVGDIYVLTGQSNMSGYGRDTAFDPPMLAYTLFLRMENGILPPIRFPMFLARPIIPRRSLRLCPLPGCSINA